MAIQKQTALSITRSGYVLTMTWKLADFYTSQEAYWSIEGNNVLTPLSGSATSVSFTIPVANYFPATSKKLPSVTIGVRGIVSGVNGPWATATYKFVTPKPPTVTKASLEFDWATDEEFIIGKGDPMALDVEYQRVDSTSGLQNKVKWGTDASSANFTDVTGANTTGYVTYTETNKIEWFRCCSRGLAGQSAWVYAHHVNAAPYAATGLTAKINGTNVQLSWKLMQTAEHPVDYQYIQYCYATPTSEDAKGIPICPSGVTWTTGANNILPTATKAAFAISQLPPADKCLFIRVCAVCESYTSTSDAVFAMGGPLVNPAIVSVSTDTSTGTTVITFTDNSTVSLTKVAIVTSKNKVLATIAHGTLTATVQFVPDKDNLIGLLTYQGTSPTKPNMRSDYIFGTSGDVPLAPTSVAAVATERDGVAEISWNLPWTDATGAEISWADHDDAWMSTDGPETYVVSQRTTRWNVAGLISGVTYYFRVRLYDSGGVYGPYSKPVTLSFASAPGKPTLTASAIAIQPGDSIQLSWTYETTDTTEQALAVIYDGSVELARVENNSQRVSVTPAWLYGSSHSLTVQTTSRSGYLSAVSDAVVITVAARPTISPVAQAITSGITNGVLTDLPIVMTVTGAGDGGQTTIKIERLQDYFVERPDGSVTDGYGGETIYAISYTGDGQLTINAEDLVGAFDDGGDYRITAIVQDSVGQKAESFLDFVVGWTHQAEAPTATVTIQADLTAKLKATAPASYLSGDTVDIYRLSKDKPELIVKGGAYGTDYIDPYPASNGGYRFVDITANGDYTTATGIAWIDKTSSLVLKEAVIDFNGNRLMIPYNLEIQNTWEKDFKQTKYLNGHVVGDWNVALSRVISISTDLLKSDARINTIRELAAWTGICHVRTPDGSSYSANVQVAQTESYTTSAISFTLNITRVDPEGFEGIEG